MPSLAPQLPANAPFTIEQRAWLNGWIAGLLSCRYQDGDSSSESFTQVQSSTPITILYGTQTGTAERLARQLAKTLPPKGLAPTILGMESYVQFDWLSGQRLLVITSTYGDGDPPDNAAAFWRWLSSDQAPSFPMLRYSVCALGDTNYEKFCAFGRAVDERLAELGATRLVERVDCDVEYDTSFSAWVDKVSTALSVLPARQIQAVSLDSEQLSAPIGTRSNPHLASLLKNVLLTSPTARKETRHFEIYINGMQYEVGDALGVMPRNGPKLVEAILCQGGWKSDDALRHALFEHFDITNPSKALLEVIATRARNQDLLDLLKPERSSDLRTWLYGRDVLDVLALVPSGELSSDELTATLKKLQPRLYSISSSLKVNPGNVHLTVAQVRYEAHGRARAGVCSTFLADRVDQDSPLSVFVQPSHGFRLPNDGTRPVIMIGPGTGVAPFRAFLQDRQATGAAGKNWLFFGEQSREYSFYYQEEWEGWLDSGLLTRLDCAFSRDQRDKIYVQHRMLEHGAELYRWLQQGAYFYVCGDASRMAKDVDLALQEIIERHGGKSPDGVGAYIEELKAAKRYARDVY